MPELNCPRCRKRLVFEAMAELPFFPFCSERCKLIDLGQWLDEEHRITSPLPPDYDTEEEPEG